MDIEHKKEIKIILICLWVVFCILAWFIGILTGQNEFENKCRYESIISRINIPYVIGCEMGVRRFKE